jgi:hypothetical protein
MNFINKLKLVIIIFLLSGCSFFTREEKSGDINVITPNDYLEHYVYLGETYLKSNGIKTVKISEQSEKYLDLIFKRIVTSNEVLLSKEGEIKFHIIESNTPFIFSLPGDHYFYSTAIFQRHLKSEELFIATLAAEIIKSKKNIYEKKTQLPLGFTTTEQMLSLTRINPATKKRINEWCYIVLKRAGYDGSAFLNWIQVQNRNILEFAMYLGDSVTISSEEQSFKNYMSKQGIVSLEKKLIEANSSKGYYNFIKEVLKGKNETGTIGKNSSRRAI